MNDALLSALAGAVCTGLVAIVGGALKNARERDRNSIDADGGMRKDAMASLGEERKRVRQLEEDIDRKDAECRRERIMSDAALDKWRRDWFDEHGARLQAEADRDAAKRRCADLEVTIAAIEQRAHPRTIPRPQEP